MRCRQKVDDKTPHIDDIDQCDDPLDDGAGIVLLLELCDSKSDRKTNFNEYEGELDPKARAQDAVFAEMDTEALVLGADEDGTDNIANNKDTKHGVVKSWVVSCVEDAEEDEACCTNDSCDDGADAKEGFALGVVGC